MPEKLETLIEDFRFERRSQTHPDECICYQSDTKCHNMPDLNCRLCYCPEYDLSKPEGGCDINSGRGNWIFSNLLPNGRIWDCSGCDYPHRAKTVRKYLEQGKDLTKLDAFKNMIIDYFRDFKIFDIWFKKDLEEKDLGERGRGYNLLAKTRKGEEIKFETDEACYLAVADRLLKEISMNPEYEFFEDLDAVLMRSMGHSQKALEQKFGKENLSKLSVLMFLNFKEPGEGKISMARVFPEIEDNLLLAYVVQKG